MKWPLGLLLAALLTLQTAPAQAASNIDVQFEVINETPVSVTIRAAISNLTNKPIKDLAMEALLEGLSIPLSDLNAIRMELVNKVSYQYAIPIYGWRPLTEEEKKQYPYWNEETKTWIQAPAQVWDVIRYNYETRYREIKEDFKDWYFKGLTPKMSATINIPSNQDNEYGFGKGKLVLDITINFGNQRNPETGGYGSKGVLSLDINGTKYQDLTNSSWWNVSWQYRNVLSFKALTIDENLVDFPVLVYLHPDNNFDFSKAKDNGEDIRFVDADDVSVLPYEIESWDKVGEEAYVWVNVPQIDKNTQYTDYIYVYYGNPDAPDGQDIEGTWNDNYVMVQHMDDKPDSSHITDSTDSSYDGTKKGADEPIEASAKISTGQSFDATDDVITFGNAVTPLGAKTIMFWENPGAGAGWEDIIDNSNFGLLANYGICVNHNGTAKIQFVGVNGTGTANFVVITNEGISAETFTLVTCTWDGTTNANGVNIYFNTTLKKQGTAATTETNPPTENLHIGRRMNFTYPLGSILDEVRILDTNVSAEWIEADYLSMTDNFLYYGSEDPPPTMSTEAATGIIMDKDGVTGGIFNGTLVGVGGTPTCEVWFEYGLTEEYGDETTHVAKAVGEEGPYTANIQDDLIPGETYHYRAVGENTDGKGYGEDQEFSFTMPTVVTGEASEIKPGGFTLNGELTNMGVASDCYVYFEYGKTLAYGNTTAEVIADAPNAYSVKVTGWHQAGPMFFRIVARVGDTVANGDSSSFIAEFLTKLPYGFILVPVLISVVMLGFGILFSLKGGIENIVMAVLFFAMFGMCLIVARGWYG